MRRLWDWMYEQNINGTGLDVVFIVVSALFLIFGGAALLSLF